MLTIFTSSTNDCAGRIFYEQIIIPVFKILVVDDDLDVNTSFALRCSSSTGTKWRQLTQEAALAKLDTKKFDLIITEYWVAADERRRTGSNHQTTSGPNFLLLW